ncbi:MAG: peptide chain release factor N(5)-glutamine methyltransferase [Treponema sp.]|jgi:release factor glutamine methyltransferase|nr:peptide chain release factor N(5)-glutamine methyltransferase [Treponema sp.]
MTVRQLLRSARSLFADPGVPQPSPTPLLDCECLLSHICGTTRSRLLAQDDRELTATELAQFREAAKKRQSGLPVAYLTGKKEFFGMEFTVTPDVLIPKPDTELLVEHALSFIESLPKARTPQSRPLEIADVGTGSGCIAIPVLANATRDIRVTAIDISRAALAIARENAARLLPPAKQRAITFVRSNIFSALHSAAYTLILSNPPYVPSKIAKTLLSDGRNEPLLALDGGEDGLDCVRALADQAAEHLTPDGCLLLETGEYNIDKAEHYLASRGFREIIRYTDLGGYPRLLRAVVTAR